jgi:hypothetical protein
MVLRRQADSWLSLTDKTATALYRRDPARLGAFVREHAQQSWRQKGVHPVQSFDQLSGPKSCAWWKNALMSAWPLKNRIIRPTLFT